MAGVGDTGACKHKANAGTVTPSVWAPLSNNSIRLDRFTGVVYYTVDQDGYRVVATLVSGPQDLPIRFVATLAPEQHITISVPQKVGEQPIGVDIMRKSDQLMVGYANPCAPMD